MDIPAVLRRIDLMEQLLQDLRADVMTNESEPEEQVIVSDRQGTWTRTKLETLYPRVEHLTGVMALFDLTAELAPSPVSYQEVLRRSGLTDQEQRNDHSRLSWAAKELFGNKRWPVDWQQPASGDLRYRMPAKIAQWWLALRQQLVDDAEKLAS